MTSLRGQRLMWSSATASCRSSCSTFGLVWTTLRKCFNLLAPTLCQPIPSLLVKVESYGDMIFHLYCHRQENLGQNLLCLNKMHCFEVKESCRSRPLYCVFSRTSLLLREFRCDSKNILWYWFIKLTHSLYTLPPPPPPITHNKFQHFWMFYFQQIFFS